LTSGTTSLAACRSAKKEIRPARSTIDMDAICKTGKWVQTCETWARNGLPQEDSIYQVAAELAKWLYWIEMYHLPPEKRQEHVHKLLVQFVECKHNGMCDRLIQGRVKGVVQQLGRVVQEVIDHGDVQPWQDMRRKRASGEYHHVIQLAPLMVAVIPDTPDDKRERHGSVYSVGGLGTYSDEALPAQVVTMIERKAGRNKLLPFATKFLNHLYKRGGRYGVSRTVLMEMLGYNDPVRVTKYRDILVKAGVISKGGYRAHVKATEYTLLVMEAFDTARGVQQARCS
jgi:hypothetical protein